MLSLRLPFLALFVAATGASVAHAERAIECTSDADCAAGQFCALSDCGPACDPDDVDCEPSDCGTGGLCFDLTVPPADCATDADCSDGDVCIIEVYESCSGGGSEPSPGGEDQAPPRDPPTEECKSETYAYCGPQWLNDCTVDADCGAGFNCQFLETSTCACTAPDDDASTDECVCEDTVSSEGTCILDEVACTIDSDCDGDFVCHFDVGVGCDGEGCGPEEGGDAAPPEFVADEGYCAPIGFSGPREDEEEAGNEGEGEGEGEAPTVGEEIDEPADTDDTTLPVADDERTWADIFGCSSTSSSPTAALPFVALGLGLIGRRRRR